MDWTYIVMESVREMLTRVGAFIPKFVGILIILILGWLIAKVIETVLVRGLKMVRLDTLSEKSGTSAFLVKGGIKYTLSELIGVLGYWVVMLIVIITALNTMQLTVAAELLNTIVAYIPNIIVAIFILVLGMFLATLLGTFVRTATSNAGMAQAKILSEITQTVVVIFTVIMALQQLNIETGVIVNVINISLAAVGLGLALAFGLGCKDIAGKAVAELVEKLKKR